jgi:hypothetical protein
MLVAAAAAVVLHRVALQGMGRDVVGRCRVRDPSPPSVPALLFIITTIYPHTSHTGYIIGFCRSIFAALYFWFCSLSRDQSEL